MLGGVHVRGLSLNCAMRDGRYCRGCGWDGRMGTRDAKRAEARGVAREIADELEDCSMSEWRATSTLYPVDGLTDCGDCVAYWDANPYLTAACASVGIEHGKSTYQMIREYLAGYHERGHRKARPVPPAEPIDPDDLGMLVWCAINYGSRLPYGIVPERIWKALTPEWRAKITEWMEDVGHPENLAAEARAAAAAIEAKRARLASALLNDAQKLRPRET